MGFSRLVRYDRTNYQRGEVEGLVRVHCGFNIIIVFRSKLNMIKRTESFEFY